TGGLYLELTVVAAVVIGGTALHGGNGTLVGTVLGVLLLGILANGINLLQISSFYQPVSVGLVLLVAAIANQLRRYRTSPVAGRAPAGHANPSINSIDLNLLTRKGSVMSLFWSLPRRWLAGAAAGLLALSLAACGDESGSGSGSDEEKVTLGFVNADTIDFHTCLEKAMELEAAAAGAEIIVANSTRDPAKELANVE